MSQNRKAVEAAHALRIASDRAAVLETRLQQKNAARHKNDHRAEVKLRHNSTQLAVFVPVLEDANDDDRIDDHADVSKTVQPRAIARFRLSAARMLLIVLRFQLCVQILERETLPCGKFDSR